MRARRTLIRNAWIITLDPELGDLQNADLLIEGRHIAAVGRDLGVEDAEVIDGTDRIVIPGFVDSHRHTWQTAMRNIAADWTLTQYFTGILVALGPVYRAEDTYAGSLLGTLEAHDGGISTLLDWSHALNSPDHSDAAYQALADSGSRAVLAHGNDSSIWVNPDQLSDWSDLERVRRQYCSSDDQLITVAMAPRGPDFGSIEPAQADWRKARELGIRISVHIGVGGFGKRSIAQLHDHGLLGPDTTYVHCSRSDDDELAMIADSGGSASVAAEVEMHMGHGYPPTARLLEVGIRPSLSVDVCTGIGGDMFGQMRINLALQRAMENEAHLDAGTTPESLSLRARDILEFATIQGARAMGLDHKIGTLTPGKQADVVVLRADRLNMYPVNHPVASAALAANTSNVESVFVAGTAVKRDGELVGVDLDRVRRLATESRDYLLSKAEGACIGGSWFPKAYVVEH
ncbi:MAG: 5-methylthioadenosine/S-adenosylhomocysteine deaminase [Thermoleophilaceae bacterium]|nr:5-methylthioadenosine/S-adenosylhomocysteine deaminase [Thermoleophilaceae bacterium]